MSRTTRRDHRDDIRVHPMAVAVASGKGGVGKTNVVANLAGALTAIGRRVLVLDADLGLSNLDVLLGLNPRFHIGHYLSGERKLDEILIEGPDGILILPAASGLQSLTELSGLARERLLADLRNLGRRFDFLLVDTAAGISSNVTSFVTASARSLVVTNAEPTALVDAYALIKVVRQIHPGRRLELLVNSVESEEQAQSVYSQLRRVARQFLSHSVELFGWVARDDRVSEAVHQQELVVHAFPDCPAAGSFRRLAEKLSNAAQNKAEASTLLAFPDGAKVG